MCALEQVYVCLYNYACFGACVCLCVCVCVCVCVCERVRHELGPCGSCAPGARPSLYCCFPLTLALIRLVAPQLCSVALHNDKGPARHQAVILGDIHLIHNIATCGRAAAHSGGKRQLFSNQTFLAKLNKPNW